jgi:hypothetical protein
MRAKVSGSRIILVVIVEIVVAGRGIHKIKKGARLFLRLRISSILKQYLHTIQHTAKTLPIFAIIFTFLPKAKTTNHWPTFLHSLLSNAF